MAKFNKKKIYFLSSCLLLTVVILVLTRQCSFSGSTFSNKTEKSDGDTIDVAIEYSPVSIYFTGDSLGGLNYELVKAILDSAKLDYKIHPVSSIGKAIDGLMEGDFDLVVADMPIVVGEQTGVSFTQPLYLDRQVLLQHKHDSINAHEIKSVLDLAQKHIWVVKDSPMKMRLQNLSNEIGDTIYVEEIEDVGSETLFMLTSIGDIDYSVINERQAKALLQKGANVRISTNVSFTQFQGWAYRNEDQEFGCLIDSVIQKFKTTEAYKEICKKNM